MALAVGCAGLPRSETTPPAGRATPAAPLPLPSAGEPAITGEIAPGERHRYRLELAAGRWASIELRQLDADLDLRLLDAAGREVAAAASPGNWSDEVVDLVAADHATYLVEVAPAAGAGLGGGYRLRIAEERPARADDAARIAARRELRATARLRHQGELDAAAAAERLRGLLDEAPVDWLAEEVAELRLQLGDALFAAKRMDESAAAYRAGLEAVPPPPAGVRAAELTRGLARSLEKLGEIEEARRHHRQAVAIARRAGDLAVLGSALNSEGIFFYNRKELDAAIERLAEAADVKHTAGDFKGEVTLRLNLAVMLHSGGHRGKAVAEYERAARVAREAGVKDSANRISLLRNLAVLYRASGEVEEALAALREALDVAVAAGDEAGESSLHLHLGALLNLLGDYAEARATLQRAADLARTSGSDDDRAAIVVQLGWAELGDGDAAAARELLEGGMAPAGMRADLQVALLHALGTAEMAAGDPDAARRRLTEALELAQEGGLRLAAADLHHALGNLHLEEGELVEAAAALERAAVAAEELADPLRRAAVASLLARVAAENDDPAAALEQALAAIALREEVRSRIVDPSLRATFLARWRGDFDLAIEMLMRLSRIQGASAHLEHAFRLSEAAHARTLSELLAEARIDVRRGMSPELLAAEREAQRELSLVQSELTDVLAKGDPSERLPELVEERRQAQLQVEAVQRDIRRRNPSYADIHHPQPPSVEEVQALLPGDTALLEYALGETSSVLFVVTRERFAALPLAAAGEIGPRVARVRELIGGSPLTRQVLAGELAELTRLLLAPAAEHLATVERLLVVPDRDLFYLPFETLGDPGAASPEPGGVLRRWTVTYLPSAAVLAHFVDGAPPHWEREVLLFADPPALVRTVAALRGGGADLVPQGGLGPLPGARHEAKSIAQLFPAGRTDLFVGEAAREGLLKTPGAVAPARRLHIASHGRISETHPASSFLLLAADAEQDGLLQIHEVFNLDLSSELVVLSGCDTALGRRVEGEGLVGLARAFLYAGARDLVVSLWPVDDVATPDLMVGFYSHLAGGRSPAVALRRAKLAALDGGAAPAVWAPFVLFGPPER